jgi:hypothetical protein
VLDRYCRSHEVANLYVVDGSFMPTSGGVPSTITIMANAFRVADHPVQHLRSGAGKRFEQEQPHPPLGSLTQPVVRSQYAGDECTGSQRSNALVGIVAEPSSGY